ncbi:hypothetical protein [Brucella tritici]|uniref:Uncharacterized protein n=1 Tax=Brucella tritici TaxID=94626 RepID=A0A6L3YDJ9_9HYPH|nr:hypothetical protein [Brucella tritici]KAB2678084.1 hypothetical protein F9L08_24495 [Brucella tritici]
MSLDKTLTEVRYAYRYIWKFQQRILDTVRLISEQFDDRLFYQWSNYKASPVARTGTSPFNFAAEHFLPLYGASFLFTSSDPERAKVQKGNWMLEICVAPDTAHLKSYLADLPFDPVASEFGTPETTQSIIRLIVWKCESEYSDGSTWLHDVWGSLDWPPLDTDGEIFTQLDGSITSVAMSVSMSQLADRQQIIDFSSETKELILSKMNL